MANNSDSGSDVDASDEDVSDLESEEEAAFFRGPWFSVVDPQTFQLPEPDFTENAGPVNFGPGMAILDFFVKFLHADNDNDIIDILVRETNRYADQKIAQKSRPPRILGPHSRFRNWVPVTSDEMLAFIGIVLSMGIVKKPTFESYWESNPRAWSFETPNFGKVMSRNRFQAILQFLHCSDNLDVPEPGEEGYDPLHKISPVINILNETFGKNYSLNQDVCVDERMDGFKGRHQLKQYISNKKAHRWGIKLWVLSDSITGYTHHINVYKGRRNERRSPNGQGYQAVMDLMEPHFYKDHHVTFDSFFTSPALVYDLLDKGTHSTGTVIKTRKGMPSSFKTTPIQKGEIRVKTRGGVMAILWADRRVVSFLTTTGSPRFVQTTNGKGRDISIPAVVEKYNHTMGGVDLGDQLILQFEPQFKSLKMWRKLLFHSLVTAAVNAFICYRDTFLVQQKLNHLKFHQQLCQELIGGYRQGSRNRQMRLVPVQHRTLARLTERHFPSVIPEGKRKKCVVCAGNDRFKKTRIQWWCQDCEVGLCVDRCFRLYHTRIHFK